jgi:hypothetical protein
MGLKGGTFEGGRVEWKKNGRVEGCRGGRGDGMELGRQRKG